MRRITHVVVCCMIGPVLAVAGLAGPVSGTPLPSPPNGRIAFALGGDLWTADIDGTHRTRVTHTDEDDSAPALSPDGTRIAFVRTITVGYPQANDEIMVLTLATGELHFITHDPQAQPAADRDPAWSPDGTRLAFDSTRGGSWQVWTVKADGTSMGQFTSGTAEGMQIDPTWSPDGHWIAFSSFGDSAIKKLAVAADGLSPSGGPVTVATSHVEMPTGAAWSPDGSTIAYIDAGHQNLGDIYTAPASGTGTGTDLSNSPSDIESDPTWSPDGTRLLFQSGIGLGLLSADGSFRDTVPNVTGGTHLHPSWARPTCQGKALTLWGTAGDDVLTGTAGDDVIAGLDGDDVIRPGAGADVVCGGAGTDTVSYADHTRAVTADLSGTAGAAGSTEDGPAGVRDTIGTDVESLVGGRAGDRLTGNARSNRLDGGPGGDVLLGGAGADRLWGGTGADRLLGGAGADRLHGEAGADRLGGGSGADRFRGGTGRDKLVAVDGAADTTIDCGASRDPRPALDPVDPAPISCP